MPTQPFDLASKRNIVVGAGYCFFDPEDTAGLLTGELYLGDGPGFTFSMETDKTEIDSSDTPTAETLVSLTNKVTRASQLGVRNVSSENFAFFIGGSASTVTQSSTPITGEALNAGDPIYQGRYYQLGASTSNPTGVSAATSISLSIGVDGTDYQVDEINARVYIIPGSSVITDGLATVTADYTPTANSRTRVTSGTGPRKGSLRFVSDNTAGENTVWFFPRVELSPSGDVSMKDRADPVEMTFDVNILTRAGYEQVYIDNVPV